MKFIVVAALAVFALANPAIVPNCPRQWNYASADQWGSFCPAWAACSGLQQSPIDATVPSRVNVPHSFEPDYKYYPQERLHMFNTGRAIKIPFNKAEANTFCTNGETFYLREVQIRSPSEHRINGVEFDLEIQFIHDSLMGGENNYAVVSVFFNKGKHSWFLDQLFFDLPEFDHCWCGNNRLESWMGEECDNGAMNMDTADACRSNCTLPKCGDGIKDNCEQCDQGASNSDSIPNRCRENCILATCGDGVVDDLNDEECDDGNRHNLDGCSSICRIECGDRYENTDPRVDPDGGAGVCSAATLFTAACTGLNFPEGVEECDDGGESINLPNGCRLGCLTPYCGDGVTDNVGNFTEACDYGPLSAAAADSTPDSCRSDCQPYFCGDGVRDSNEQCDFGTNNDSTGCNSTCFSLCGDGITQNSLRLADPGAPGEDCDDADANANVPNSRCRTGCSFAYCGDGIVDDFPNNTALPNEMCDEGLNNGARLNPMYTTTRCTTGCQIGCGNGLIEPSLGEECDNTMEDNLLSVGVCRPWCILAFCGDGITDPLHNEECDDGVGGSPTCRSNCLRPVCGDGTTDPAVDGFGGEQCDDGNNNDDDGCNSDCRLTCGNGYINMGEECDDGDNNSNEIPNACRSTGHDGARCVKYYCGDGVTDNGEACDDGIAGSANCRSDCTLPYCGDGVTDSTWGEECDHGALNSDVDPADDACSSDCVWNRCRRNTKVWTDDWISMADAFPMHNHSMLCYRGSLTSPPCTEGANWALFEEPQTMSVLQYAQIRSVLPHVGSPFEGQTPKRPLQALNGRSVNFCNAHYQLPAAKCGNGWSEGAEECDDGLANSDTQSDSCRTDCRLPHCGDGVVDMALLEECEPPSTNGCNAECHYPVEMTNPYATPYWSYKRSGDWWQTWPTCEGDRQSPINLVRDWTVNYGDASTAWNGNVNYNTPARIEIYNTENLPIWKIRTGGDNTITVDGSPYSLDHITIHSPAEHTIEGMSYDLEVQFHHRLGPNWASVAVLYDTCDTRSKFLDDFWFYLPKFTEQTCGNGKVEPILGGSSEQCDDGEMNNDFKPNACRTNCHLPMCGDGIVDRGEQCDDGSWNLPWANHCRANCMLPYCGDGITDNGEECDDANNEDRDGCDKKCKSECGNGVEDDGEDCDNGVANGNAADACRSDCKFARCSDGVVDSDEECDLGEWNADQSNSCRTNCRLPRCGDGIVDPAFGEQCDAGAFNNDDHYWCDSSCQIQCGDGFVDNEIWNNPTDPLSGFHPNNEECDDGDHNGQGNSQCRSNCKRPACGDGILDTGNYGGVVYTEMCDDGEMNFESCCPTGNPADASCMCPNAVCHLCNVRCGDGITQPGEQCDDGTLNNNHEANCCRFDCMRPACGDGILDAGEECDDGANMNNLAHAGQYCRPTCVLKRCGDGILDWGEQCDGGAGCTSTCLKLCGNGLKDAGEACDDGAMNGVGADQCRPDCTLPFCGDGYLDAGEQCDTGAASMGRLDNACRNDCTLPVCGDGVTDSMYGEDCDNGDGNDNTVENGCSKNCRRNSYRQCIENVAVDLNNAIPKATSQHGIYRYAGSRAMPPCTENTQWIVYAQAQCMSASQLMTFREIFPDPSARGIQCAGDRQVVYPSVGSVCGNCKREGNEECDDGAELNSDSQSGACRTNCKRASCGDGVVDDTMGEQCEPSVHDGCDDFCKWKTACPVSSCSGNTCSSCKGNCGAGCNSCSSAQQVPANSTVINVNFANMLASSACTTCSR